LAPTMWSVAADRSTAKPATTATARSHDMAGDGPMDVGERDARGIGVSAMRRKSSKSASGSAVCWEWEERRQRQHQ
jgi:hypothetical protein